MLYAPAANEQRSGSPRRWPAARQRLWLDYGVAVAAVLVVFAGRFLLAPILHQLTPFFFFGIAVLVAAARGGLGPGLLATALGGALGFVFVSTVGPSETGQSRRLCHRRRRDFRVRRVAAPRRGRRGAGHGGRGGARGASALDPRHRARRHGRHRRARARCSPSAARRSGCSAIRPRRCLGRTSSCSCRRPTRRRMTAI